MLHDLLANKYLAQFHQIYNLQLFYEFQGQYPPVCTHGASMAFVVGLLALVTSETTVISPHVRKSTFWNLETFCLWNPESWKFLL